MIRNQLAGKGLAILPRHQESNATVMICNARNQLPNRGIILMFSHYIKTAVYCTLALLLFVSQDLKGEEPLGRKTFTLVSEKEKSEHTLSLADIKRIAPESVLSDMGQQFERISVPFSKDALDVLAAYLTSLSGRDFLEQLAARDTCFSARQDKYQSMLDLTTAASFFGCEQLLMILLPTLQHFQLRHEINTEEITEILPTFGSNLLTMVFKHLDHPSGPTNHDDLAVIYAKIDQIKLVLSDLYLKQTVAELDELSHGKSQQTLAKFAKLFVSSSLYSAGTELLPVSSNVVRTYVRKCSLVEQLAGTRAQLIEQNVWSLGNQLQAPSKADAIGSRKKTERALSEITNLNTGDPYFDAHRAYAFRAAQQTARQLSKHFVKSRLGIDFSRKLSRVFETYMKTQKATSFRQKMAISKNFSEILELESLISGPKDQLKRSFSEVYAKLESLPPAGIGEMDLLLNQSKSALRVYLQDIKNHDDLEFKLVHRRIFDHFLNE